MSIDVAQTAKDFEQHAQAGKLPELLSRDLHNLNDADRLAVAKQIEWDMRQHQDPSLPKVEFYDTGDLKSVETHEKTNSGEYSEHTELDKNTGKVRSELNTSNTSTSYESVGRAELTERDADGHITHKFSVLTEARGTSVKVTTDDDKWAYDAKTGKKVSHDETTSWGKKVHEEYDGQTGNEKFEDITSPKGSVHRTYDSANGKLRQEDIVNEDKTTETLKYNSNGDKLSREKRYGTNGSEGTRIWNYSPLTGDAVYTEWRDPSGRVEKMNIDKNGKYTRIED